MVETNNSLKGFALRGLEAVASSHMSEDNNVSELINTILDRQAGKSVRLISSIKLGNKIIPGLEQSISKHLYSPDRFPFKEPIKPFRRSGEYTLFLDLGK